MPGGVQFDLAGTADDSASRADSVESVENVSGYGRDALGGHTSTPPSQHPPETAPNAHKTTPPPRTPPHQLSAVQVPYGTERSSSAQVEFDDGQSGKSLDANNQGAVAVVVRAPAPTPHPLTPLLAHVPQSS